VCTKKTYSGSIPSNLNLDDLFIGVKGNKTRIRYLKEGMVYFLSLLTPDNYYDDKSEDGYRTLNIKVLEKTIGKGRPTEIIRILKDRNVIEVRQYRVGHYSRGYRFCNEYHLKKPITIEFSERINDRLSKSYESNKVYVINQISQEQYSHLDSQFDSHDLGFDLEGVQTYLKSIGNILIDKSSKLRKYKNPTFESLFNYIGRIGSMIDDIENSKIRWSVSPSRVSFASAYR